MIYIGMCIPVFILFVFTPEIQFWKIIIFLTYWNSQPEPAPTSVLLHSLPKGTKLTKLHWNNSLTDEFIEAIFKSRYFWEFFINPSCSKQLSSVPRKRACYKWHVFHILIYTTWHKHKYYSVCKLIATVPLKKKLGTHGEQLLTQGYCSCPPPLDPKIKSLSALRYIIDVWSGFSHLN